MEMFCNQCQEAAKGVGCEVFGICGKSPELNALMDTFLYSLTGLSSLIIEIEGQSSLKKEINKFIIEGLFSTITNGNFKEEEFVGRIHQSLNYREQLKNKVNVELLSHDVFFFEVDTKEEMINKAIKVAIHKTSDEDIRSIRELILFGLKGAAAYLSHAEKLGYTDENISNKMNHFMKSLILEDLNLDDYVQITLELGNLGVEAMALLDRANTETYGQPEISKVSIGVEKNPGILITGHDLYDLKELLEQTKGLGIDVYTHGEMLPAHYYPEFKKYPHLRGNYGNAWHMQLKEFESFKGPIIFTTNCLVPPRKDSTYASRTYTTGNTGHESFSQIKRFKDGRKDFSEVINQAKTCLPPLEIEQGEIVGGFAHNQVTLLADKVVDSVKNGDIKNFVVMAGCDGRFKERSYYTEFAKNLPKDAVILTAGCAKYRYNKLELGDIGGIPRILDAGQCNDSYSLAMIALKLKEAFELSDINELPIVYNIAWYEQKAVIVFLALLSLGVKKIHLGPTLPAFLSPNITNLLVNNFEIGGISAVEQDIIDFLN